MEQISAASIPQKIGPQVKMNPILVLITALPVATAMPISIALDDGFPNSLLNFIRGLLSVPIGTTSIYLREMPLSSRMLNITYR